MVPNHELGEKAKPTPVVGLEGPVKLFIVCRSDDETTYELGTLS
jgi:hypothetical protein